MNIGELINNPKKLEEEFWKAIEEGNEKNASILVDFIDEPSWIVEYAKKIVGGKVDDKLEDVIASNYYASLEYAKNVLNGPFEKGERVISEFADKSYYYAKDVLKGPFVKGEPAIIKNKYYLNLYLKFLKSIGELDEFYERHPSLSKESKVENNKRDIKKIVDLDEWQRLRESLVGTWKHTPQENVKKLREFLGDIEKTSDRKLAIILNYLTGSGFRIGVISHPEITKLREEVKKEIAKRKNKNEWSFK